MLSVFPFSEFLALFPNDTTCLEEIKKIKYPDGILCTICDRVTRHYKLLDRNAYSCKECRQQVYLLAGTIFEKSPTQLRLWFYVFFLMTHTKGGISAKQLQRELGVTYKTAWRMFTLTKKLMDQNNGDLLAGTVEIEEAPTNQQGKVKIRRWTLFNKLEITLTERQETSA